MQLPFFVTPLYAALCGLLLFVLGLNVVRLRRKHRIALGDGGNTALTRAMRAHANFAEYVPLTLFLLFLLELSHRVPLWALHLLGAALFVGRVLHAFGLSRHSGESPGRIAGIGATWTVLLVASVWLLVIALTRLA